MMNLTDRIVFKEYKKSRNNRTLVHIVYPVGFQKENKSGIPIARGIVAIGPISFGVVSIGIMGLGGFSVTISGLGLISLGLAPIGLLSVGIGPIGYFSIGCVALGVQALGNIAIGHWAVGNIAIGHWAVGNIVHGAREISLGHHPTASEVYQALTKLNQDSFKDKLSLYRIFAKIAAYPYQFFLLLGGANLIALISGLIVLLHISKRQGNKI
ncbi:MAG: hypothetical protein LBS41_06210 [Streptococcaceae bacterium]|jgi:hypothetical protein|nr:hypothetical protein [Streptococcaceae bacterium]